LKTITPVNHTNACKFFPYVVFVTSIKILLKLSEGIHVPKISYASAETTNMERLDTGLDGNEFGPVAILMIYIGNVMRQQEAVT